MIFIPIISSILYLIGGQWWRPARWLIGLPIGIFYTLMGHSWIIIPLSTISYWIATSVMIYGEDSWLNKYASRGVKFALCGLVYGIASIWVLGWILGAVQAILGAIVFIVIKVLDDMNIIKNPWVELLRGGLGTILFVLK